MKMLKYRNLFGFLPSVLFLAINLGCANPSQEISERKMDEADQTDEKPSDEDRDDEPRGKKLLSKVECVELREEALARGCINQKGLRALKVLEAAPICTDTNEFSYWRICENEANSEVNKILDTVQEECSKTGGTGGCQLEEIELVPKSPSPNSRGQRVMVIDGFKDFRAWRYKSKVLDILKVNEEGNLESATKKMFVPKAMKDIDELLEHRFPWISSRSLDVSRRHHDAFWKWGVGFDHGLVIFNRIVEFNPKAEFLLVELKSSDELNVCAAENDAGGLDQIREDVRNEAASIIKKVREYDINYINMSFGKISRDICDPKTSHCSLSKKTCDEISKIYLEEYFVPLSSLKDVIIVQASADSPKELYPFNFTKENESFIFDYGGFNERDLDHLTDCVELPNRLRIGKTSLVSPGISEEGSNDLSKVDDEDFRNALRCTDFYINEGLEIRLASILAFPRDEEVPYALWGTSNGVRGDSQCMTGSSFVAPVAVSYLISLKNENPELSTEELLNEARKGGVVKDLLRHELHPFNVFGSQEYQDIIDEAGRV